MGESLFDRLKFKRKTKRNIMLNYKHVVEGIIDDDYYDTENIILSEMLCKSVAHAKQEICKLIDIKEAYYDIDKLCHDYDIFLLTIHEIIGEYYYITVNRSVEIDDDIEALTHDFINLTADLAALHNNKISEKIVKIIKSYIEGLNKENIEEKNIIYQQKLFETIGDDYISIYGDIKGALEWYSLIAISNKCFDSKEQYENIWYQKLCNNIKFLMTLSNENVFHTYFIGYEYLFDMSSRYQDILNSYLDAWGDYQGNIVNDSAGYIWECAMEFGEAVACDLEKPNFEFGKKIRTALMTSVVLLELSGFYYLIKLSNGDYKYLSHNDKIMVSTLMDKNIAVMNDNWMLLRYFWVKTNPANKYRIKNLLNLVHAMVLNERILAVLRMDNYKGKIAYYTSLNTLYKMLPSKADTKENIGKFSVMHVAYMNDPSEGKVLSRYVLGEDDEKNSAGRIQANYPYVFIKCFTNKIDNLPMWEMYGNHASGCCIVLDMETINNKCKRWVPIYSVCYVHKTPDNKYIIRPEDNETINGSVELIEEAINNLIKLKSKAKNNVYSEIYEHLISRIRYLFKSADYAYECEKRILYTFSTGNNEAICKTNSEEVPLLYIISDIGLYIDEIILGPKFEKAAYILPDLQSQFDELGAMLGMDNKVLLTYSSIEYK